MDRSGGSTYLAENHAYTYTHTHVLGARFCNGDSTSAGLSRYTFRGIINVRPEAETRAARAFPAHDAFRSFPRKRSLSKVYSLSLSPVSFNFNICSGFIWGESFGENGTLKSLLDAQEKCLRRDPRL